MKISKSYIADFSLLVITAFWASSYSLIKDLQQTSNAITLLFYRLALAAALLGLILWFKKMPLFANFRQGFILGFILWVTDVPQSIGLNYTKASNTAFIIGMFIIFLPLINYLFGNKKLERKNYFAIILSIIGLWMLTGGVKAANLGDWITLISALAVAAHVYYIDKFVRQDLNPYVLAFQQFLTVAALSLVTTLIFGFSFSIGRTVNLWGIFYLAIFANLIAYVVQNIAQKHTITIRVGLIFLLEPVFASIFAWTLRREVFMASHALGGLLILLAMAISEFPVDKIIPGRYKLNLPLLGKSNKN